MYRHLIVVGLNAAAPLLLAEASAKLERYQQMGMARGQQCVKQQEEIDRLRAELERAKAAPTEERIEAAAKRGMGTYIMTAGAAHIAWNAVARAILTEPEA